MSRRSDRGGHGEDVERSDDARGDRLDPPLATHRAGEAALLAEYPGTEEVLAAAAATRTTSQGSSPTRAVLASATCPACSTTPSASGRRTGDLRISPVRPRVDNVEHESRIA